MANPHCCAIKSDHCRVWVIDLFRISKFNTVACVNDRVLLSDHCGNNAISYLLCYLCIVMGVTFVLSWVLNCNELKVAIHSVMYGLSHWMIEPLVIVLPFIHPRYKRVRKKYHCKVSLGVSVCLHISYIWVVTSQPPARLAARSVSYCFCCDATAPLCS